MKILAIIGTTRKKGDSYHLIQQIETRMNLIEPVEFKYLYLSDIPLGYCLGCCNCFFKGEELCSKRALTAGIEAEMLDADGVILAAPVYAHQVTALMKNYIDHFSYFFHRPRFFDKVALVLSPTGSSGLRETLKYLRFTANGWGFYVVGSLGVVSGAFKNDAVYRGKIINQIDQTARQMLQFIKTKKRPAPNLYQLMFFRGMRLKAKYNPCDRKYWEDHGWLSQNYFMKRSVNPVTLLLANILERIMDVMYRKMARTKKEIQNS